MGAPLRWNRGPRTLRSALPHARALSPPLRRSLLRPRANALGVLVHEPDQRARLLGIRGLVDAVPEIEDVARTRPDLLEDLHDDTLEVLVGSEECHRVDVALYRELRADLLDRTRDVDPPVEPDDIASGLDHQVQ